MEPILEALAAARDDLRVVQVDVDADQVAARYGVLSMPTFVLFRDGAPWHADRGPAAARLDAELDAALGR